MSLLGLPTPPAWMDDAACQLGIGTADVWFPDHGGPNLPAQKVCATCDVTAECLAFAIENRETGTWGGVNLRFGRPTA